MLDRRSVHHDEPVPPVLGIDFIRQIVDQRLKQVPLAGQLQLSPVLFLHAKSELLGGTIQLVVLQSDSLLQQTMCPGQFRFRLLSSGDVTEREPYKSGGVVVVDGVVPDEGIELAS